jgi:hypothetical protein
MGLRWVEAISLRIVGICFVGLAIYVTYDSMKSHKTRVSTRKHRWHYSSSGLGHRYAVVG